MQSNGKNLQWVGDLPHAHGSIKTADNGLFLSGILRTNEGAMPINRLFNNHVTGEPKLSTQYGVYPVKGIYRCEPEI